MKRSHWSATTLALLATAWAGQAPAAQVSNAGPGAPQQESPLVCDRTALTPEQRTAQRDLGKILRAAVIAAREVEDGFEFDFPSDPATYRALTEYLPLERACCPFFEFNLRIDREGGPLHWRLSGRKGVKEFIREEVRWLFKN